MSSLHRFNSGVRRYPFSTRKADLAGRSALQGRNRGRLGSAVDQPARNRLVPGDVVFVVTGVDRVARPGWGVCLLRVAVHEIEQLLTLEPGRDLLGFQPGARAARQVFDPAGHNGHRCQTKPDRSIGQNHPIHCHCARPFDQIQPGAVLQTLPSFRPARDSRPACFDLDSAAGRSRFRQILDILGDARRTRKVSVLKETREQDQNRHPFHRPGGASGSLVSCGVGPVRKRANRTRADTSPASREGPLGSLVCFGAGPVGNARTGPGPAPCTEGREGPSDLVSGITPRRPESGRRWTPSESRPRSGDRPERPLQTTAA